MKLHQKIESGQATVAVVGLGYVGLPVAVAFAQAGYRVLGIDLNEERVAAINRGESYIDDIPSAALAEVTAGEAVASTMIVDGPSSAGDGQLQTVQTALTVRTGVRLMGTTDFDALYEADAAIICVPTPLSKTKDPDLSYVVAVTDEICKRLHRGMLIVLESTTYPGTTLELVLPRLQEAAQAHGFGKNGKSGAKPSLAGEPAQDLDAEDQPVAPVKESKPFVVGTDFFLAFSPERIDPGRVDYTFQNTPKVIGGVTPACTEMAQALYERVIDQVVPVSSPTVAEMVKLLENTFRAVNIALVNEMAIMCDRLGTNVWEVIEAAKTKPFGFMPFYPGPGLGGHCIPIDPQYLAWKLKTLNYNARFIQLAADINADMPRYVLAKIASVLNEAGKPVRGSRVLVLGVSYKADVDDIRESPALELLHLLQGKGADVTYHDPHVPRLDVDGLDMTSVALAPEVLQNSDCVVIVTAHSDYDWDLVVSNSQLVVDTRNATQGVAAQTARISRL